MWAYMLIYRTVDDIGRGWYGPTSVFFQGTPNPLATALTAVLGI